MDGLTSLIIVGSLIALVTLLLIIGIWVMDMSDRWPVKGETKQWNIEEKQRRKAAKKLYKQERKLNS